MQKRKLLSSEFFPAYLFFYLWVNNILMRIWLAQIIARYNKTHILKLKNMVNQCILWGYGDVCGETVFVCIYATEGSLI